MSLCLSTRNTCAGGRRNRDGGVGCDVVATEAGSLCKTNEQLSAWFVVIVWRCVVIQGDLLKLESIQPILNSCVVYLCSTQPPQWGAADAEI